MLIVGAALGGKSIQLRIDGRPAESVGRGAPLELDLELGYFRALPRRFALGALLRGGTFPYHGARAVGARRSRVDLRLAPVVSFACATDRGARPAGVAGLGFGPTVAWIRPPARDAVVERYDTGVGLHAAVRLGVRLRLVGATAGYYVMEGALHRVSADRTAAVRGSAPHAPERYRFDDYSLGAAFGIALSL
jgi:hypothetical protein